MKKLFTPLIFTTLFVTFSSFTETIITINNTKKINRTSFSESFCRSAFSGDIKTYTLQDNGYPIGHSLWISRRSGRMKAKYFAHKDRLGNVVDTRYKKWRSSKEIVLVSSGTYATGWDGNDKPVGLTVDNGKVINRKFYDKMDALVIVYATGGIVVSNIEDGDLYLDALKKKVDVRNYKGRNEFLAWAQKEGATVFQTHLLAYKNQPKFGWNAKQSDAVRKFLILAKDNRGELFHIIFYMKNRNYGLKDATQGTINYLKGKGMDVIGIINLDTGGFDIISTHTDVRDCSNNYIVGHSNNKRPEMTNMLAYYYD